MVSQKIKQIMKMKKSGFAAFSSLSKKSSSTRDWKNVS